MHPVDRSDSFDIIEVNEMTVTPTTSRAQLPALEPFKPASHSLRVELAGKDPKFPSLDFTGPPPVWDKCVPQLLHAVGHLELTPL